MEIATGLSQKIPYGGSAKIKILQLSIFLAINK